MRDYTGMDVKRLRERLGMTQKELAELLGVSHRTVWRWENEQTDTAIVSRLVQRTLAQIERGLSASTDPPLAYAAWSSGERGGVVIA